MVDEAFRFSSRHVLVRRHTSVVSRSKAVQSQSGWQIQQGTGQTNPWSRSFGLCISLQGKKQAFVVASVRFVEVLAVLAHGVELADISSALLVLLEIFWSEPVGLALDHAEILTAPTDDRRVLLFAYGGLKERAGDAAEAATTEPGSEDFENGRLIDLSVAHTTNVQAAACERVDVNEGRDFATEVALRLDDLVYKLCYGDAVMVTQGDRQADCVSGALALQKLELVSMLSEKC